MSARTAEAVARILPANAPWGTRGKMGDLVTKFGSGEDLSCSECEYVVRILKTCDFTVGRRHGYYTLHDREGKRFGGYLFKVISWALSRTEPSVCWLWEKFVAMGILKKEVEEDLKGLELKTEYIESFVNLIINCYDQKSLSCLGIWERNRLLRCSWSYAVRGNQTYFYDRGLCKLSLCTEFVLGEILKDLVLRKDRWV